MTQVNNPVSVVIVISDGNGTYAEISDTNPLPGTGGGGGGGTGGAPASYGDPTFAATVNAANTLTPILAKDATRSLVEIWNVSDVPITIVPEPPTSITFGQGIILDPSFQAGGATLQYPLSRSRYWAQYTNAAIAAIHASTGGKPLYVVTWST